MAWNDLTISQRSQLMNLFRRNGVSSLSEMRRLYDLHSPSLVEATPSPYNPVAPVYDNGGYMPSEEIKNYIKGTEAFRSKWYKDANGNDTVGYGFTGKKVKELYPNGMTQEQADAYFDTLIPRYAQRMAQLTPNFDRLSQNQKDALFSYFYNIGEGNYSTGSPKMQQALRDFDLEAVLQNIDAGYNDSRNPGLRKRRDYERSLFERDMTYPLQPVPPAVQRGPLYAPEITRTVINVPWAKTTQQKVNPFMYACGGKRFDMGGPSDNRTLSAFLDSNPDLTEDDYAYRVDKMKRAQGFVNDYYNSEGYKRRAVASGLSEENPLIQTSARSIPAVALDRSVNRNGVPQIGIATDRADMGYGVTGYIDNITAHELGHANKNYRRQLSGPEYPNVPQESYEILSTLRRTPINEHDSRVNESYSDLLDLRYQLKNLGIFDSTDPNAVFDKSMLQQYKKKGNNSRFLQLHDDDTTIRAINEVAMQSPLDYGNYAAVGGNLFRGGGNTINVGPQILSKVLKDKYIKDYVNRGSVFGYPIRFKDWINYGLSPYTWRGGEADAIGKTRRALFGKYMGIEPKGITFSDYVEESPYRPSNETDSSSVYYRPKSNEGIDRQTMFEDVAGRLKMGHGVDENGKGYISYYDVWDLAPFSRGTGNEIKGSTPIELYDRFYEDEYPEMYERYMRSHGLWPQEIPDVNATVQKLSTLMKATGGKIYIKPSHRGRFTDLMSRTGHSASWFKAHGTPAQKKMAVFALNARKWKHSHGGFKF